MVRKLEFLNSRCKTKNNLTEEQYLKTFQARVLNKHGTNAEVFNSSTITCLYDRCGKEISCKQFNRQNFERHVKFYHSSKKTMLLTMIGQSTKGSEGEETKGASSTED